MSTTVTHKYGLVLSGGGIRGVAHIGVIKALGEAGIHPTIVSGTSAGSLVGALYAAGRTWQEMLEFFKTASPFSLSRFAFRRPGMFNTSTYRDILSPYFPSDSFESLDHQLYVTATNLNKGAETQFHQGPLIRPLLASVAVPGVFSPVMIDGVLYSDGGIINNFPLEPLVPLCEHIIGVSVNPIGPVEVSELQTSRAVIGRALSLDISNAYKRKLRKCTVSIEPAGLSTFGMFEMNRIEEIFRIGYEEAQRELATHLISIA